MGNLGSDNSVDNGAGYDGVLRTVWQYGAEYASDNNEACSGSEIMETDRLGGVAILEGTPLRNAWTAPNDLCLSGSGFDKEFLFAQMSTLSGFNPYPGDSAVDIHTGITFDMVDMTAKATYQYLVAFVTTNQGEADYLEQVSALDLWTCLHGGYVGRLCVCYCRPGDANSDLQINVGDAVYLISYVFKSGSPPVPYNTCSGDANRDCECNVGDAVYIINYVFKGGPLPPDCDSWANFCGWWRM